MKRVLVKVVVNGEVVKTVHEHFYMTCLSRVEMKTQAIANVKARLGSRYPNAEYVAGH